MRDDATLFPSFPPALHPLSSFPFLTLFLPVLWGQACTGQDRNLCFPSSSTISLISFYHFCLKHHTDERRESRSLSTFCPWVICIHPSWTSLCIFTWRFSIPSCLSCHAGGHRKSVWSLKYQGNYYTKMPKPFLQLERHKGVQEKNCRCCCCSLQGPFILIDSKEESNTFSCLTNRLSYREDAGKEYVWIPRRNWIWTLV